MALITDTQSGIGTAGSFLTGLKAAARALAGMFRFHQTLRVLEELDDNTLRDIGLTRGDLTDLRMASTAEALSALSFKRRAY